MSEIETVERTHSGLFVGLVGFAVLASFVGLVWSYTLENRVEKANSLLSAARQQNAKLAADLDETNARLRVTSETLGRSVGLTQRQLEQRASDLLKRQQADAARLEHQQMAAQAESQKQIGAVTGDLSSVKTDVGGVKTDVAQTKSELQSAESRLQSALGDLGVQSGLIATNSKELDILKHKGDRNYYEFNLKKGAKPTPISGVALALKKADQKHSRYTLTVEADDRKIEKKDRGLNEPVQFYTGRANLLYELVVNNISKNHVSGYLSTPKGAPAPLSP
ncbi:MAG TPA: hypothetical protein VGR96_19895 [Acidobacteriaceae bacterium]|nr:hypothetical protein [Acidobacteriaceae bacterium]